VKPPWVVPWRFLQEVHALKLPMSRWGYGALFGTSGLFGFSLGTLLGNAALGAGMALFFAYAIPGEWLEWMHQRRQKKMRSLWIEAVRNLRTSYLVCGSLRQAMVMSLPHFPDEVRPYFQHMIDQEQAGLPFHPVMEQDRFLLPELTYVLELAQLLDRVGGPDGEMLLEDAIDRLEEAGRRVEEFEQEVAARRTETRHLFALFLVELLFLRLVGSVYFSGLFHSATGQGLIFLCFAINAGCFIWVRQRIRRLTG